MSLNYQKPFLSSSEVQTAVLHDSTEQNPDSLPLSFPPKDNKYSSTGELDHVIRNKKGF